MHFFESSGKRDKARNEWKLTWMKTKEMQTNPVTRVPFVCCVFLVFFESSFRLCFFFIADRKSKHSMSLICVSNSIAFDSILAFFSTFCEFVFLAQRVVGSDFIRQHFRDLWKCRMLSCRSNKICWRVRAPPLLHFLFFAFFVSRHLAIVKKSNIWAFTVTSSCFDSTWVCAAALWWRWIVAH